MTIPEDVRNVIGDIVHEFMSYQRWTLESPIPDEDINTLAAWFYAQHAAPEPVLTLDDLPLLDSVTEEWDCQP